MGLSDFDSPLLKEETIMIAGLQKMTLLDYPGKVACTVFLQGCNFRCPFCHNSDLLPHGGEPFMDEAALLAYLEKRKGLLDAVCISGGEPTLQPGLPELVRKIKALGYLVKLDTNGAQPKVLKALVREKLLDYVAMDVKNGPSRYAQTAGLPQMSLAGIEESLAFLISDQVDYELRTTVVEQLHDEASIEEMGQWLANLVPSKKPRILYLQRFTDRDSVIFSGLSAPEEEKLQKYLSVLSPYVEQVKLRGE